MTPISLLERGRPPLVSFLTAGYPTRDGFGSLLRRVAPVCAAVEIGVPFSDPMADGVTVQRASRAALEAGVSLRWILETLRGLEPRPAAPLLLMSYLNPLLAFGLERLAEACQPAGVRGVIVPDLPLEECDPLREALGGRGVALVQLVTPVTPTARLERLCRASRGFVYAVTLAGTTGGEAGIGKDVLDYLDRVGAVSDLPVCAGFGIRSPEQVRALAAHADGIVVGSALIEALERGEDPVALLQSLGGALGGALGEAPSASPLERDPVRGGDARGTARHARRRGGGGTTS